MPNWITEPKSESVPVFVMSYERILSPGTGFQFECTSDGVINEGRLTPMSRISLEMCRSDLFGDYRSPIVVKTMQTRHTNGVLRCKCGCHHTVLGQRNTSCMVCDRHYNPHGVEIEMEDDGHGM